MLLSTKTKLKENKQMCRHSGKSTNDFCKQTDEQIIKLRLNAEVQKLRECFCLKKYGVDSEWEALKLKDGVDLDADDGRDWPSKWTKESMAKMDEIARAADKHVDESLGDVGGAIEHDVKKTADFYRMCSKVGSALAAIRKGHPTADGYSVLVDIMNVLTARKLADWTYVAKPECA